MYIHQHWKEKKFLYLLRTLYRIKTFPFSWSFCHFRVPKKGRKWTKKKIFFWFICNEANKYCLKCLIRKFFFFFEQIPDYQIYLGKVSVCLIFTSSDIKSPINSVKENKFSLTCCKVFAKVLIKLLLRGRRRRRVYLRRGEEQNVFVPLQWLQDIHKMCKYVYFHH